MTLTPLTIKSDINTTGHQVIDISTLLTIKNEYYCVVIFVSKNKLRFNIAWFQSVWQHYVDQYNLLISLHTHSEWFPGSPGCGGGNQWRPSSETRGNFTSQRFPQQLRTPLNLGTQCSFERCAHHIQHGSVSVTWNLPNISKWLVDFSRKWNTQIIWSFPPFTIENWTYWALLISLLLCVVKSVAIFGDGKGGKITAAALSAEMVNYNSTEIYRLSHGDQ